MQVYKFFYPTLCNQSTTFPVVKGRKAVDRLFRKRWCRRIKTYKTFI